VRWWPATAGLNGAELVSARALGAGHESTLTIRNNLISWQTRADLQSWLAWWKILAMQWWAHGD
jgi:hypothetical protein